MPQLTQHDLASILFEILVPPKSIPRSYRPVLRESFESIIADALRKAPRSQEGSLSAFADTSAIHVLNTMNANLPRYFFSTSRGRVGVAPQAQKGDCICVLSGCNKFLVMRQRGDYWILVGEAYVAGAMKVLKHSKRQPACIC